MAGCTANNPLLSLPTWKAKLWPDSLAGPAEIPVAQPLTVWAPASSFTVWFAPLVNAGESFTAVTMKLAASESVCPPKSLAVNVIVSEPFQSALGMPIVATRLPSIVTVRSLLPV